MESFLKLLAILGFIIAIIGLLVTDEQNCIKIATVGISVLILMIFFIIKLKDINSWFRKKRKKVIDSIIKKLLSKLRKE